VTMPLRREEAVMLGSHPLGEGGRIVSFLTRNRGKVRGVARSSRRLKSKFGAALEPFTRAEVVYFEKEGRDLVTLDQAYLLASPYRDSAHDLEVSWHLQYVAEVVEQVAPEGEPQPLLFRLLAAVGDAVQEGVGPRLACCYFELWLLRLQGVLPGLDACTDCSGPLEEGAVADAARDAFLCRTCAPSPGPRPVLDRSALRMLRESVRRPLPEIAAAGVARETVATASRALRALLLHYVGKEIKSIRFIESLEETAQ